MNYYSFHIGDFRSGTVNMTRQARWIYRDMLDIYYDTERPLTLDLDRLCDDIGVMEDAERAIVQRLLRFKFTQTDGGYVHAVCEAVIAEYRVKAETAKANGKLGGRPRKADANPNKPSGFSSGSEPDANGSLPGGDLGAGSQTNQEPRTNNQEPNKKGGKPPVDKSGFDEFWNAWPKNERKQDKAKCKAKWEANGFGAVLTAILADINVKLGTEKWRGGFIEAPEVYLNNKRWEDGVTANAPGGAALPVPWQDSAAGVDAKAAELGLAPIGPTENRPNFKIRVMAAVAKPPKPMSLDALNELLKKREAA